MSMVRGPFFLTLQNQSIGMHSLTHLHCLLKSMLLSTCILISLFEKNILKACYYAQNLKGSSAHKAFLFYLNCLPIGYMSLECGRVHSVEMSEVSGDCSSLTKRDKDQDNLQSMILGTNSKVEVTANELKYLQALSGETEPRRCGHKRKVRKQLKFVTTFKAYHELV